MVVQTQRGHDARRKVLDKNVGVSKQSVEQRFAGCSLQVERYALLVRIQICEQQAAFLVRLVVGEGRQAAGRVALRSLDLDDLSAEIGKEFGAVGAGDMLREVEYADAL